ncbi:MAG: hypothetical protein ABR527_06860 [Gemmatimonadota bacterium]
MLRGTMPLLLLACAGGESSACDGFDDRELAITSEEYRTCAGEILAALDSLEPRLQATVAEGDAAPGADAREHYRTVKELLRKTGIEGDYRSFQPQPSSSSGPTGRHDNSTGRRSRPRFSTGP